MGIGDHVLLCTFGRLYVKSGAKHSAAQFKFDASNTAATGSLYVYGYACSGPFMGAVVMAAATATFCL